MAGLLLRCHIWTVVHITHGPSDYIHDERVPRGCNRVEKQGLHHNGAQYDPHENCESGIEKEVVVKTQLFFFHNQMCKTSNEAVILCMRQHV